MIEAIVYRAGVLLTTHVLTLLAGIYLANHEIEASDISKSVVISLFSLLVPVTVYYFFPSGVVVLIYLAVLLGLIKIIYVELNHADITRIVILNLLGFILFGVMRGTSAGMAVLTVIAGGVFVYVIYQAVRKKRLVQATRRRLPIFKAKRADDLRRHIKENPDFRTFCHEYCHYDSSVKDCGLQLRVQTGKFFKFNSYDHVSYCLYWNLTEDPNIASSRPDDSSEVR